MRDILLLSRAWNFAAQRHATQRRKGKAQEPYVNHLAEVAELVANATDGQDVNLVAAAVLHDTVEDTDTLFTELATVFNTDIADLVAEVTDDKSLEKTVRKRLQVEHAPTKSERAKVIKLADKTSNLRSLVESPPDDWSLQRRKEYLDWALEVARGLRGTNGWLEGQFDEAAEQLAASCVGTNASGDSVRERTTRTISEDPRFKEAKPSGQGSIGSRACFHSGISGWFFIP